MKVLSAVGLTSSSCMDNFFMILFYRIRLPKKIGWSKYLRALRNSKYRPPKTDLGRRPHMLYIARQACRFYDPAICSCFMTFAIS